MRLLALSSQRMRINILTKFHKDWMKTINILTKFHKECMKTINILTKFHKDWMKTINILTKFHKDWMKTVTSIVYISDLINILTKFHKDWMKTVTSTVYTNKLLTDTRTHTRTHNGPGTSHGHISSPCHFLRTRIFLNSHVIQLTGTIFEHNSCIKETNKNAPPTGSHVFSPIPTIFIETKLLTKSHEDETRNVASRVFTSKC
ncbi:hypothetical protein DPMN_172881 [Dreissena polymorpha]|uniref:Uncharacterized protein n=1 Tax=Dreissena polymorpha TaxID=45954 RepID=A0A9D4E4F7_DREPO|nr:hypothetical protein DPMN_172881 [Dreissena polymorpha]